MVYKVEPLQLLCYNDDKIHSSKHGMLRRVCGVYIARALDSIGYENYLELGQCGFIK